MKPNTTIFNIAIRWEWKFSSYTENFDEILSMKRLTIFSFSNQLKEYMPNLSRPGKVKKLAELLINADKEDFPVS
ncbi:hypothetical protein MKW92_045821 [Papaver armeniacum]|nr:hypothetical protein MKW92_045821 [Papaver armeniacum]